MPIGALQTEADLERFIQEMLQEQPGLISALNIAGIGDFGPKVGDLKATAAQTIPGGWLVCEGQEVDRSQYDLLFKALGEGSVYGDGDGSTTFNLPDLRGRVPVGVDQAGVNLTTANDLGESGGEDTHTLTEAEMPAHLHPFNAVVSQNTNVIGALGDARYEPGGNTNTGLTGGDDPHENMPPYQVVNWIVKT